MAINVLLNPYFRFLINLINLRLKSELRENLGRKEKGQTSEETKENFESIRFEPKRGLKVGYW